MTNQGDRNQTDIFEGFDPPSTTDGSYRGKMATVRATELQYEEAIEKRLKEANIQLKNDKTRVTIRRVGNGLYLRATLPLKPGDTSKNGKTKQYMIGSKIPANFDGIKTAIEEAYKLGTAINRKSFRWEDYIDISTKTEVQRCQYYYDHLDKVYFETRKRTIKSEHTFNNYKDVLKRYIGLDTLFDQANIEQKIRQLPDWCIPQACTVCQVIIKDFNLGYRLDIKKPNVQTNIRRIPDDREIISSFDLFAKYASQRLHRHNNSNFKDNDSWMLYRWCYGMLATYGLRPRELFVNPDIEWWLSGENIHNSWKVSKDTKTGYREVIPFIPEWVEKFDLKNPVFLEKLKILTADQSLNNINKLRKSIARWFNTVGIDFFPYDLRHACAIRAHLEQNIPIKAAADNLGHSVEQHTETYQKWIDTDKRKKAFDAAITKKDEFDKLRQQIIELQLENEKLKIENERLKLASITFIN